MQRKTFEHIHLLGIAGAAMAPVAGMLQERGYRVTGSDVGVYPPASTLLDSLGIRWSDGYRQENLKPAPDLVVIGNVIARGNAELEYILDEKIPYCSMAQLLEDFFIAGHKSIVVAGTHGKTTTTAMLAWIFHVAGRRPDFLVGGVIPNFNERSYGLGGGEEFIIEGDEYETAFFDRGPYVAGIRSCGHLSGPCFHREAVPVARQSRAAPRADSDLGRERGSEGVRRESAVLGRDFWPHARLRLVCGRYSVE
jgi:UDP-N-acetylmuramate-alanine ligase